MNTLEINNWPDIKPDLPFDGQGWCMQQTIDVFKQHLNQDTRLVVELGAWLGLSTRHLLDLAPNATIITIDTWKGSTEHSNMPEVKDKLPILYDQFIANCWQYRDRLIPIKGTTRDALFHLLRVNMRPDLIYIDASHAYHDVYGDIAQSRVLVPNIIIGDDWTWNTVKDAAIHYCQDHHIQDKLHSNNICWWIDS